MILILEARFYPHIADLLYASAEQVIRQANLSYDRLAVPGAFELPAALAFILERETKTDEAISSSHPQRGLSGVIALGCVIRGQTSHYDLVTQTATKGLEKVARQHLLPLGFGLLTCENHAQAIARAMPKPEGRDKGAEAAHACLAMIKLKQHHRQDTSLLTNHLFDSDMA